MLKCPVESFSHQLVAHCLTAKFGVIYRPLERNAKKKKKKKKKKIKSNFHEIVVSNLIRPIHFLKTAFFLQSLESDRPHHSA